MTEPRQAFQLVPDNLLNVARIDGAGDFRLLWQIALPVVRPTLAALDIILFLASWNDDLWPLIVLNEESAYTMPVALGTMVGLTHVPWDGIMVGAVISMVSFLFGFLALQRQFIAGGAIKG